MKLAPHSSGIIDLQYGESGIVQENTLQSAVIVSLLSDRRADQDDALPDSHPNQQDFLKDRKGWSGDAFEGIESTRIGSRLWLLVRAKQTEETRRRALFYAREALQWLIDDGVVSQVDLSAEWKVAGRLDMSIRLHLVAGTNWTLNLRDITGELRYAI